ARTVTSNGLDLWTNATTTVSDSTLTSLQVGTDYSGNVPAVTFSASNTTYAQAAAAAVAQMAAPLGPVYGQVWDPVFGQWITVIVGYVPVPITVTLNLAQGTYHDLTLSTQDNVTLVVNGVNGSVGTVNGTTIDGNSPALVVTRGNVVVRNVAFTTATDSRTVLVTRGSLTLRNDVVQESTGYDQAAIRVEGGTLDLGTPADPGGNTINVNGAGQALLNTGGFPVTMYGNTWQTDGVAPVEPGQSAGIGFWRNNNGRALINALGTTGTGASRVGQWLAATYPNLFGGLSGSTPDGVWGYFRSVFNVTGTPKLEAQVMATALAV